MKFLLALAAVLPLASAAVVPAPVKRITTPANDPFYAPPLGFESAKPGDVLRERTIAASFLGLIPDLGVTARQLLYRTTAIDGSPIATVTTIFKPLLAKSDRFIAFNTAYDSSAAICAPSYNYRLGALQTDIVSSVEYLVIEAYLFSGYIVASSDYEGPDVAFTPGRLSGQGVLDGMRAVVNYSSKIGLTHNPMIVNVGYSGGAIAGGWAASLHPTYAPELNIKGWIIGGTPANLTDTLVYVDNTIFSGFLPGAVAGLLKPSAYQKQLQPVLDKAITNRGRNLIADGNNNCVAVNLVTHAGISIFDTSIQTLGRALLTEPAVAAVLMDTTMGLKKEETPTAPVMLYHAQDDEIIPFSSGDSLRQRWCANGATVRFTNYAAGGHFTTEGIAIVDALGFASDAFSGIVPRGCASNTVLNETLNPLALGLNLEPLLAKLGNTLLALGKKDSNLANDIRNGKSL